MRFSENFVRQLTSLQRDMLIDHIDGQVVVLANHLKNVRNSLIRIGLLAGWPMHSKRPRATALTEPGRQVVGMILGQYADALVRAGLLDRPLDILQRLKAIGDFPPPAESAPIRAETIKNPLKSAKNI